MKINNNNLFMNNLYIKIMSVDLFNFISLHDILLPKDIFTIEKNNLLKTNLINDSNNNNNNKIIINYNNDSIIKILYTNSNNKILLELIEPNINSSHTFRLIKSSGILDKQNYLLSNEQKITEYLLFLNDILLSDNKNLCTICGKNLKIKGQGKILHCDNNCCECEYYSCVTDNRLLDLYNQDPRVFMFLLNIFISGLSHPKVEQTFKPFPYIPNIKTIEELKKIIPTELQLQNHIKLMNKFNESSNDIELYSKLNNNSYCIIKNAISNNYFSMSSRENVIPDSSVIFIHINYSAEIENKFQQNHYLFHGSSSYSWYPIIKNGLKVMSGTEFQANGAAYGNGVYFSDSFQFSLGYSSNNCGSDTSVVGVFEILEDPSKYKKSTNIYVISDEKILLLRSLVITKSHSKISGDITNYFIKELPLQKKINKLSVGILKNKRLDSEFKKLSNESYLSEIKIIDQTCWEIEFASIKNKSITIQLIFSNYPISPPIIKLISNNMTYGLGFVESDNTIKIDITNPSSWKITNNLIDICSYLHKCFIQSI